MGDFAGGTVDKNPPANAGDMSLIPGLGAEIPYDPWPKKPKCKTEAIL